MLDLYLGRPGGGQDFREQLLNALTSSGHSSVRLRAGFAYATYAGVAELLNSLRDAREFHVANKLWLVGVHHGVTEPIAINALSNIPNSMVKLATCGLTMQQAILGARVFHAKAIAIETGSRHSISTLIIGSANLTGSAIGQRMRNFEAGIIWKSPIEDRLSREFNSWWREAWSQSMNATPRALDQYAEERDRFLSRNPDVLRDTSPHTFGSAANARMLWIEAGAMRTGGSRNAVDFNVELASFFGSPIEQSRMITLVADGKRWSDRPLSPKTTRPPFNVRLWRLSLPTKTMGGFDYPDTIISFTKENDDQSVQFRIGVADADSSEARDWRLRTQRYGVVGRTGGGHSYGFM